MTTVVEFRNQLNELIKEGRGDLHIYFWEEPASLRALLDSKELSKIYENLHFNIARCANGKGLHSYILGHMRPLTPNELPKKRKILNKNTNVKGE